MTMVIFDNKCLHVRRHILESLSAMKFDISLGENQWGMIGRIQADTKHPV